MSRCATAFAVAGVLVCLATPAYPCLNGTILEGDRAVQRVVQVEAALDAGNLGGVAGMLDVDHFMNHAVSARWYDAKMLFALRTNAQRVASRAIEYFTTRTKQDPKSIKHRAWLAEAYAAGRKRDKALEILVGLRERDLMPDAYAWRTLAVLSDGSEVDATLEICKKRAKNPAVCTIAQSTKPMKTKPKPQVQTQTKMRL